MSNVHRPYIPLSVKLAVLERQAFVDRHFDNEDICDAYREWCYIRFDGKSIAYRIRFLKNLLFGSSPVELDHDPALVLRRRNRRTGGYIPDANDPRYLVYRLKPDHLRKSVGRSPGAERTVTSKGSDIWWAKKFRKLESPKKTRSRKIPSRPFSKQKRTMRT